MKATTTPSNSTKPFHKRTWVLILSSLVAFPLVLFCLWYLIWFIGFFDFSEKKLSITESCKDYRLLYYINDKGNGHIDLVDKNGKIFGSYNLKSYLEPDPVWDADCKGVRIGLGEDAKRLEVTK